MAAQSSRMALVAVCLYLLGLVQVSAITTKGPDTIYCSNINTGSSGNSTTEQYQSHGLCTGRCNFAGQAFAIMQDYLCWCSDYAPTGSNSTTGCTQTCPGFPFEYCGDGAGDFYTYVELAVQPSGTIGSAAASSTTSSQVTVTLIPTPASSTVLAASTDDSSSETPASSSTTQKQTTTSSSSSTWSPTPITSVFTTTGQVETVTFTPTASPNSQNGLGGNKGSGGGLGTGGAVGLTIGLVALVAIIAGVAWFCYRKKRKGSEAADDFAYGSRGGSSAGLGGPPLENGKLPQRTMSEHSRYVLGTDGRQVVEAWEPGDAPGRRQSRLMPVDPRLDPFAPVYQRGDHNKSRESVNTIRDDHDYSRRVVHQGPILRATNPDTSTNDD